jgi:hypothetical protein
MRGSGVRERADVSGWTRGRGRLARGLLALALALGFAAPSAAQLVVDPGTVIRTIETSLWAPPSPDPSGVTYRPDTGELLVCDAEVEETVGGITHYQGVNVWTVTRTGAVTATYTTVGRSNEPTGIAWDPAGGRLWYSDDVRGSIFEVDFGPDQDFDTPDDVTRELRNLDDAGCGDMEDVTYNSFDGHLYFTVDSTHMCKLNAGANGVFDGLPPQGDDAVTIVNVPNSPFLDPEGIVYDPFWNTLVIADRSTRDLYEITPAGGFLRKIDVNFPGGTKPAGVTIAPGTTNPMLRNYYVVDRKVDNDGQPDENDGRLFEIVAIPLGGNGAPIVDAGQPQSLQWPANTANLDGFVGDDGHPYPPSTVSALWSKQSGPGTVSFGNPNQPVTTASFSAPGSYVLQLVGNDSALQTLDTVTIAFGQTVNLGVVTNGPGSVSLDPPGGSYPLGQSVTVTATPNAGAGFVGFSGSLTGATSPQLLVMDSDQSITASFATLVSLSVTTSGPGSVTLSPPGGSYLPGTQVTLSAVPGLNAAFTGWGGALGGSENPAQLTVNANTDVSASFTQLHSVSTAAVGPGTVSISPPTGPYAAGSTVTLTATPEADAAFVGWSGDLGGATTPESLLVDADKSVTATFATLFDVTAAATGPGTISLDPPGGTYPAGTVVTVTATPDAGAAFTGFSGSLGGTTTPQLLTVDGDKAVTAAFAQQLTLSVAASGPGSVTLEPPGGVYLAGTSVTVTAVPDADAAFLGFGGDLTGTTNPQLVVVNANTSATATFATLFDVAASASGPGSIALDPPGGTYPAGTAVTVTATPDAGAVFTGFSGSLGGTTTPQLLTVDGDKAVDAAFEPAVTHTLTVTTATGGSVAVDPPGSVHPAGTIVTLTATPVNPAWIFTGWSGDAAGTENPLSLPLDADQAVHASFGASGQQPPSACGIGPELAALVPALGWLFRRRRAGR